MGAEGGEATWNALRALPMGQHIVITDGSGRIWSGSVIPPHDLSGARILTLKLENGYNVGVRIDSGSKFEIVGVPPPSRAAPPASPGHPPSDRGESWVALLTTGGTIASRVDYETGGVRPVTGEREILEFYPELERSGPIHVVPVFDRMSEDLVPNDWLTLAEKTAGAFSDGARGVVIAHGTDTLGFTAAALSFLLTDLPGPVAIVGAQRSPDRPSSDGPSNLAAGVIVARDRRLGEVVAVMHEGVSDLRFAIHRGPWVRKMHSTRRDAFESRNGPTLGFVERDEVHLTGSARPPSAGPARVDGPIDGRAGLLWSYPGLTPEVARSFAQGLRGLVIAGTGLGHVGAHLVPWVRSAIEGGLVVAMTTECLAGTADPYVYSTGRALLKAGVVYLDDLLPETAYAKLVWALGHESTPDGVRRRLLVDRAGEFSRRHVAGGAP
ncbi:MAG: Glu-tRNA(Gln) amidotransferase subunit GatD [Thermoplasmata archaeon]